MSDLSKLPIQKSLIGRTFSELLISTNQPKPHMDLQQYVKSLATNDSISIESIITQLLAFGNIQDTLNECIYYHGMRMDTVYQILINYRGVPLLKRIHEDLGVSCVHYLVTVGPIHVHHPFGTFSNDLVQVMYEGDMLGSLIVEWDSETQPESIDYILQQTKSEGNLHFDGGMIIMNDNNVAKFLYGLSYLHLACINRKTKLIPLLLNAGLSPHQICQRDDTEDKYDCFQLFDEMRMIYNDWAIGKMNSKKSETT